MSKSCIFYIFLWLLHFYKSLKINNEIVIPYFPTTLESIVWEREGWAKRDGRVSGVETSDCRTSNSKISLFKDADTHQYTQKSALRGLGASYTRELSTGHVSDAQESLLDIPARPPAFNF